MFRNNIQNLEDRAKPQSQEIQDQMSPGAGSYSALTVYERCVYHQQARLLGCLSFFKYILM